KCLRHPQPGIPQNRDNGHRSRRARLRAREACRLSRPIIAVMTTSLSPLANPRPGRFAGFTLLELLVAIAILALLSVLGCRALSAIAGGWESIRRCLARCVSNWSLPAAKQSSAG